MKSTVCLKPTIFFLCLFIFFSANVAAQVVFQDNYDDQTGWNCSDGAFFGYTSTSNCPGPDTFGGVTRHSGEISPGGRDGGNSLKLWRRNGLWTSYHGYLNKQLTQEEFNNQYRELYTSWWVKIDPDWNTLQVGPKWNRYYLGSSPGSVEGGQVTFDVGGTGSSFSNAGWRFYATAATSGNGIHNTQRTMAEMGLLDGNWHHVETRVKLPTNASTLDGVLQLWVNGELEVLCRPYQSCSTESLFDGYGPEIYFTRLKTPAIGNLGTGNDWNFPTDDWYSIEFDDYVVSTARYGPDGSELAGPPSNESTPSHPSGMPVKGELLLAESFSDNNWSSRGWYDGTNSSGVTSGGYSGSALRWNWNNGSSRPDGFSVLRRPFTATDEFLIEYYVKYEAGWQGSGLNWHPHLIHVMSTDDGVWQGLARAHSGLYFESWSERTPPYTNYPVIAHQDMHRVNTSFGSVPNNLSSITEARSANNCNTPYTQVGASSGTCYNDGVGWYSANTWRSASVTIPADQWTKITAHIKKNTYSNGVANYDGIMRLWVDSQLAIESTSVMYAAGAHSDTQWNRVVLAPWIGSGSPVNQTMWLDELRIWSVIDGPPTLLPPNLLPVVE